MPTLEEVKQFLEDNKQDETVAAYLKELKQPTREDVEGFLDTEEGKKVLQPRLDANFTKGLNTWKENNLDQLVNEKVKELYPEETPEQTEIRQIKQQLEDERKERNREKLTNHALTVANEKGLPTDIVQFFLGEDEESTNANLGTLEEKFNNAVQQSVDSKFQEGGRHMEQSASGGGNQAQSLSEIAKQANIRNQ